MVAKECGAAVDVLCMGRHDNVVFTTHQLQQFVQRIEQPLQQRIAELESAWQQEIVQRKDGIIATQEAENDRLKQRIAELEKDCDILATNYDAARRASRFTADVADQALADLKAAEKQIEQLREALHHCKGFVEAYGEPESKSLVRKALEQTK